MWRLYYHNRSTFSSQDGPWSDAPAWGVMGLAVTSDELGYWRNTADFYILPPWVTEPYGCDHWGLMDYLIHDGILGRDESLTALPAETLEAAGVKFGRTIPNEEWAEVQRWMIDDLPRKSARRRDERP